MELKLNRIFLGKNYTIGKLYVNGVYLCDTLEDVNRDLNKDGDLDDRGESKIKHETCIPFGRYEITVNMSSRFNRLLPRLLNVPNFDGILIHNGVTKENTSGCILVGENKAIGKLLNSTHYMNKLTNILLDEQNKGLKSYIKIY